MIDTKASALRCSEYRKRILKLSQKVPALHLGASFSIIEILDAIFSYLLPEKEAKSSDSNRFILSKGHGAVALYSVLENTMNLDHSGLDGYCQGSTDYGCHPDRGNFGIEASTGSLGHGLALAAGVAHSQLHVKKSSARVFVVISDGELQEGSSWEALMMAANLKLANLTVLLDHNGMQSFGRTVDTHPAFYPIEEKVRAFGFNCGVADGHNVENIVSVVRETQSACTDKPSLVLCNTVKAKGVSFMEGVPIWHYRSPTDEEFQLALSELEEFQYDEK